MISLVFSPTDTKGTIGLMIDWTSSLGQTALSVFGMVPLSFAIAERILARKGERFQHAGGVWSPSQLPVLPDSADRIKPAGLITGILFTLLFAGVLLLRRDLLGIILKLPSQDTPVLIPLFNEALMNSYLWALLLLMFLAVLNAIWKLATGRFTVPTRILSALLCFAGAVFALLLLNQSDLLDPTRGLTGAIGEAVAGNLMTAFRLSLRITSAAIAIPLAWEGIGHLRYLLNGVMRKTNT